MHWGIFNTFGEVDTVGGVRSSSRLGTNLRLTRLLRLRLRATGGGCTFRSGLGNGCAVVDAAGSVSGAAVDDGSATNACETGTGVEPAAAGEEGSTCISSAGVGCCPILGTGIGGAGGGGVARCFGWKMLVAGIWAVKCCGARAGGGVGGTRRALGGGASGAVGADVVGGAVGGDLYTGVKVATCTGGEPAGVCVTVDDWATATGAW
eukprot:4608038-Amphidinium_carterae.4